jgi:hypothetical protein
MAFGPRETVQHTAFAACDIYPADRAGVAGAPGKGHYIKAVPGHAEAARRQSPVPGRFAEGVQHFEGNARGLRRVRRAPGLCNPLRGKGKVKSKKAKSSEAREEKSKNCKARCDSVNSHGALPPFYSELCVNLPLTDAELHSRAEFGSKMLLILSCVQPPLPPLGGNTTGAPKPPPPFLKGGRGDFETSSTILNAIRYKMRKLHVEYNIVVKTRRKNAANTSLRSRLK